MSSKQTRLCTADQIPQKKKQTTPGPPKAGWYIHTLLHTKKSYDSKKQKIQWNRPQSGFHSRDGLWKDRTLQKIPTPAGSKTGLSSGTPDHRRPFANPHVPAMGAEEGRTMSAVLLPLLTDKWTPGGRLFTFYAHIETGHDKGNHQTQQTGSLSAFHSRKSPWTEQTLHTIPNPASGTSHQGRSRTDHLLSPVDSKQGKAMKKAILPLITDKASDTPSVYYFGPTYRDGL